MDRAGKRRPGRVGSKAASGEHLSAAAAVDDRLARGGGPQFDGADLREQGQELVH
jgi:hypothetical protein